MSSERVAEVATFAVGAMLLAAPVARVQEIARAPQITRVPLAAPAVAGLINLRGDVLLVIDLRRRLGLGPVADAASSMVVVVRGTRGPFGVLVDELGDVFKVAESSFEHAPETLSGAARELIVGAYKLESRLLLLLDVDALTSALVPSALAAPATTIKSP